MATDVKPKAVTLTVENVLTSLKKVKSCRSLGSCLSMPWSRFNVICMCYSTIDERKKAVVEYWWGTDPCPSWRRIIEALDTLMMEQHQIADDVRHYAEPLMDPTLTLHNVTMALASVKTWDRIERLADCLGLPPSKMVEIESRYSKGDQQKEAAVDYWLKCLPNVSWNILAEHLFYAGEQTALHAVMDHVDRPKDLTLTFTNLWSVLKGVKDWYFFGQWLSIPKSTRRRIQRQYSSPALCKQAMIQEYLDNNPAPSWRQVAEALYQCGHFEPQLHRTVLKKVMSTYIRGITLHELCLQHIVDHYQDFFALIHHLPSSVQKQIIQRWKLYCDSDTEFGKLVAAEKIAETQS